MKLSLFGRVAFAFVAALALGLSMSACGGGTIAYIWVPGIQSGTNTGNVITGYKVDNYTGNLTEIPHAPFGSQGAKPVYMVVKPGGRYVYVLNQGAAAESTASCSTLASTAISAGVGPADPSANVAVFSVGGDGVLTFQQSYATQGFAHTWATFDTAGQYLYVLDRCQSTAVDATGKPTATNPAGYTTDGNGVITVFSADATTGRLTLVQNTQSIPSGGTALTYFEVGKTPLMNRLAGSCMYTLNQGDDTVTPYLLGSAGQLTTVTTGTIKLLTSNPTSINGNSTNVIITDAGQNKIYPYTSSSTCGLASLAGGAVANETGGVNPIESFIDASGQYVFVLNSTNSSTVTTSQFSSISSWTINATNGELVQQTGAPYTVGSGPQCMVEDPTAQYMYISNYYDGTITGKLFDSTHGYLSSLTRGSTFTANGLLTCLTLSGAVD